MKITWNINSVNVQLRQWLYNHGDQCLHNTGGWIKGLINSKVTPMNMGSWGTQTGTATANVVFNGNNITYTCYCNAPAYNRMSSSSEGTRNYGFRAGTSANSNFGITNPLKTDVSKYTKCIVNGTTAINMSFRTGVANGANTQVNTATVITSGNANTITLNVPDCHPYLVLGNAAGCTTQSTIYDSATNYSFNANGTITEIYLV